MTISRWLLILFVVLVIALLLFSHLAGVEPWTVAAGALALLFATVTGKLKQAPPVDVKERARVDETSKVAAAKLDADAEAARIVEHREAESKKPAVDRAQALIDRNRARRVE